MTAPHKDPASEMEDVIRMLADAPRDGMTIDELAEKLNWPRQRANDRLAQLGGKITHAKFRVKHSSVIKYSLSITRF